MWIWLQNKTKNSEPTYIFISSQNSKFPLLFASNLHNARKIFTATKALEFFFFKITFCFWDWATHTWLMLKAYSRQGSGDHMCQGVNAGRPHPHARQKPYCTLFYVFVFLGHIQQSTGATPAGLGDHLWNWWPNRGLMQAKANVLYCSGLIF